VEYIVRSHDMRVNTTLVSEGQMKRLINTNKRYVLMVVREKMSEHLKLSKDVILLIRKN
jgi:hypothetical protein